MKILIFVSLILFSTLGLATELKCVGTEPFWGASIDIENQKLFLSAPMTNEVQTSLNIQGAIGYSKESAFMGTSEGFIVSVVRTDSCSDGMSDQIYPFQVLISTKSESGQWQAPLFGCCK